jgi:hypothetical protein
MQCKAEADRLSVGNGDGDGDAVLEDGDRQGGVGGSGGAEEEEEEERREVRWVEWREVRLELSFQSSGGVEWFGLGFGLWILTWEVLVGGSKRWEGPERATDRVPRGPLTQPPQVSSFEPGTDPGLGGLAQQPIHGIQT